MHINAASNTSGVSGVATTGIFTSTAHSLVTGEYIIFTNIGGVTAGLRTLTPYYVIAIDANTFKLATTWSNAMSGTAIASFTTNMSGGVYVPEGRFSIEQLSYSLSTGASGSSLLAATIFYINDRLVGACANTNVLAQFDGPGYGSIVIQENGTTNNNVIEIDRSRTYFELIGTRNT